jgi:hypothetical protein
MPPPFGVMNGKATGVSARVIVGLAGTSCASASPAIGAAPITTHSVPDGL